MESETTRRVKPLSPKAAQAKHRRMHTFPIMKTIGEVTLGGEGDLSPLEAALRAISRDDSPGEYTFTIPDGETYHIVIEIEGASAGPRS